MNAGFFVRNDYPRQPVPLADRRGWLIIALVWVGLGTDLAGAFVGVYLASGQTVMNALGALFIANILLGLIGGLLSYIGGKTGLSTVMLSRFVFGEVGSRIIGFALFLTMLGFFGIQAGLFGESARYVFQEVFGLDLPSPWLAFIGGLLMTVTAAIGFYAIERLSMVAVPLMIFLLASLIGRITAISPENWLLVEPQGGITLGMGSAISLVIGSWIGACIISPDVARWAKSSRDAFLSGFVGLCLGNTFMIGTTIIMTRITGAEDVIQVMVSIGWGIWAAIILILAQWTTNDNTLYSGGLALTNLFRSTPKWMLTVAIGLIGSILAYFQFHESVIPYMNILATIFSSVAAIYLVEYFLLNQGRFLFVFVQQKKLAPIYITAILSWVIASSIGLMTMPEEEGGLGLFTLTGASGVDAFLVAAIFHFVVGKCIQMFNKPQKGEQVSTLHHR